jgi:hypothetical protein
MNKIRLILLISILCILLLSITACGWKDVEITSNIEVSSQDEIFDIRLYVDKEKYSVDEAINCYATLEYIGDKDSITVYSSSPLVVFALEDDKYFHGDYAVNDELITTTFQKGQIVRYDYMKSGGWSADDENATFYEKFYAEKQLILPANSYKISVIVDCSMDINNMLGSKYKHTVSAPFTVGK